MSKEIIHKPVEKVYVKRRKPLTIVDDPQMDANFPLPDMESAFKLVTGIVAFAATMKAKGDLAERLLNSKKKGK